jgi:hypothetical protein
VQIFHFHILDVWTSFGARSKKGGSNRASSYTADSETESAADSEKFNKACVADESK